VTLAAAWSELLAEDWPRMRLLCERDVVHRAAELGRAGWAAALAGLHPRVQWRDGGIEVDGRTKDSITLGRVLPITEARSQRR
jgi:hypothetical protein